MPTSIKKRLDELWKNLQGKKSQMPNFLREIRLDGIRGIDDLKIVLDYPVSVIAGENASGKSTVLFAAACAYRMPGKGAISHTPARLFPDYTPKQGRHNDVRPESNIDYGYTEKDGLQMRWRRGKSWGRPSFRGRKGGKQPERFVYLRTLSHLRNPAEVRSVLQMSNIGIAPQVEQMTATQIDFAQKMLPFEYNEVSNLSSGNKSLLFANNINGASYSELHMASGERAVLQLSREIAQLNGALVLIDEVEAGLHTWAQQMLMVHLQELALRNDLQVIVTSHSPVVLESVPQNARIFLGRNAHGKTVVLPAYRDIVQNALYARSTDTLNLLCEDKAAESILLGIMDFLSPDQKLRPESFRIGTADGVDNFPGHAAAFRKFDLLENLVFILDGDQRGQGMEKKIFDAADDRSIKILFLPGDSAPEKWIWDLLKNDPTSWSTPLNVDGAILKERIKRLDAIYPVASVKPGETLKDKLYQLGEILNRDAPDICRTVAEVEAKSESSNIKPLVENLKGILLEWRAY